MRITKSLFLSACALVLATGQAQADVMDFNTYISGSTFTQAGMLAESLQAGGIVHIADNNSDGSLDLLGDSNGYTTTYRFSHASPFTLNHLNIVGQLGGLGKGTFTSNLGGTFTPLSTGIFNISSLLNPNLWMGINSFTWTQTDGGLVIDDINFSINPLNGPPQAPITASAPEPSSMILMGSGLAALIARRLRKQQA